MPIIIPNNLPKEALPKYSLTIAPLKDTVPPNAGGKRSRKGIISHFAWIEEKARVPMPIRQYVQARTYLLSKISPSHPKPNLPIMLNKGIEVATNAAFALDMPILLRYGMMCMMTAMVIIIRVASATPIFQKFPLLRASLRVPSSLSRSPWMEPGSVGISPSGE